MYIAKCPEVGTVSQGYTIEEALENLKEATELYLEEFPRLITSDSATRPSVNCTGLSVCAESRPKAAESPIGPPWISKYTSPRAPVSFS
jgi:predicted RNase H-like HicB family nuclease